MTTGKINNNPWDEGLIPNLKYFYNYQAKAILHLFISLGLFWVWGLKKLQSLIQRS